MSEAELRYPPLLIRASAGSGKTYRLSNRYLQLLLEGEEPQRILATTFTRKAAAEIQERIFQRLAGAATDNDELQELSKALELDGLVGEQIIGVLRSLVCNQHRLNICTLDSFFARLALGFGSELGLSPGWGILEGFQGRLLKREAVRQLCGAGRSSEVRDLFYLLNRGDFRRAVHAQIEGEITDLHELFQESPFSAWSWFQSPPKLEGAEVEDLLTRLAGIELPLTAAGKPDKRWERARSDLIESGNKGDWRGLLLQGITQKVISNENQFYRKAIPDQMVAVLGRLIEHAGAVVLAELERQTKATHALLTLYDERISSQKQEFDLVTFSDLKQLLAKRAIMGQLDSVYYRLDTSLSHLLLDEFQDTSRSEWRILEPLADEILSKSGLEHTFFCVGDTKQAIYGWRGGVSEIFDSLQERWPQVVGEPMERSYRSAPVIMNAVNQVFENLVTAISFEPLKRAAVEWCERFTPHTTARENLPGYVTYQILGESDEEEEHQFHQRVAEYVKGLTEEVPRASIGILVRRNSTIAKLQYALSHSDIGIVASGEGGNPLTDSQAVSLVLAMLILVDHPSNSVACYHVARSPLSELFGAEQFQNLERVSEISAGVRAQLVEAGYGRTLSVWVEHLKRSSDARESRRLEQLLELSFSFDLMGHRRPSEFVEFVETQRVEDPSGSSVRVMTIHQAKGLEFDIVILPELERTLARAPRDPVMTYRESPLEPPSRIIRSTSKEIRALLPELQEMYEQQQQQRFLEELSVLYVALTRPRFALHLLSPPPKPRRSSGGNLADILRTALASESMEEAGSSSLVFESGERSWYDSPHIGLHSTADSPIEVERPLLFKDRGQGVRRILSRESPSAREGESGLVAEQVLSLRGSVASKRGSVLHRLFEQIDWLDEGLPDSRELRTQLLSRRDRVEMTEVELNEFLDTFLELLRHEQTQKIFSQNAYLEAGVDKVDLYREFPFIYRDGDTLLSGVFDRLVVSRSSSGSPVAVHLIDFKTDRLKEGAQCLSTRVEFYEPQVRAYREAVSRIFLVEQKQISSELFFTDLAERVPVTP